MVKICAVYGCPNRSGRERVSFYRFPYPSDRFKSVKNVTEARKNQWLRAINRSDLSESKLKNARVCSLHFVSGKPAALNDSTNPDWIPHLKMGYVTAKDSTKIANCSITNCSPHLGKKLNRSTAHKDPSFVATSIEIEMEEHSSNIRSEKQDDELPFVATLVKIEMEEHPSNISSEEKDDEPPLERHFVYVKEERTFDIPGDSEDTSISIKQEPYEFENVSNSKDIEMSSEEGMNDTSRLEGTYGFRQEDQYVTSELHCVVKLEADDVNIVVNDNEETTSASSELLKTNDRKPSFQSQDCIKTFTDSEFVSLPDTAPTKTKKNVVERFVCRFCDMKFPFKRILLNHLINHVKQYENSLCNCRFKSEIHFNNHEDLRSSGRTKCLICKEVFCTSHQFKNHTLVHGKASSVQCKECKKYCLNVFVLQEHKILQPTCGTFQCTLCLRGYTDQAAYTRHIFTHDKDQRFACRVDDCNVVYNSAFELGKHIIFVHEEEHV